MPQTAASGSAAKSLRDEFDEGIFDEKPAVADSNHWWLFAIEDGQLVTVMLTQRRHKGKCVKHAVFTS